MTEPRYVEFPAVELELLADKSESLAGAWQNRPKAHNTYLEHIARSQVFRDAIVAFEAMKDRAMLAELERDEAFVQIKKLKKQLALTKSAAG